MNNSDDLANSAELGYMHAHTVAESENQCLPFLLPSLKTSIGAGLEDLSACRNEVIVDTLETYGPR